MQNAVGWLIAFLFEVRRLDGIQRAFLHREIGFDVHVCGRRALVPEPERDNSNIHSALEHVHGGRVPNRMRRDPALGELRAGYRGTLDRELEPCHDGRAGEPRA